MRPLFTLSLCLICLRRIPANFHCFLKPSQFAQQCMFTVYLSTTFLQSTLLSRSNQISIRFPVLLLFLQFYREYYTIVQSRLEIRMILKGSKKVVKFTSHPIGEVKPELVLSSVRVKALRELPVVILRPTKCSGTIDRPPRPRSQVWLIK